MLTRLLARLHPQAALVARQTPRSEHGRRGWFKLRQALLRIDCGLVPQSIRGTTALRLRHTHPDAAECGVRSCFVRAALATVPVIRKDQLHSAFSRVGLLRKTYKKPAGSGNLAGDSQVSISLFCCEFSTHRTQRLLSPRVWEQPRGLNVIVNRRTGQ